nr:unnamed protein product [Callosobruchus chinensis]
MLLTTLDETPGIYNLFFLVNRYSRKSLPVYPICGNKNGAFKCISLKMKDIQVFQQKFYGKMEKLFQDKKRVHKLCAKAYFELLREEREGTATFSFDCQKNQLLPKLPDQEAYYSHKIYLFIFTVVQGHSHEKLNPSTDTGFCWTENEYPKRSNKMASCIHDILEETGFSETQTIRLMCDACGGQNKNTTLVGICCNWLLNHKNRTASSVTCIEIIFLIQGHSFVPPDQVFGNMEKEIRKLEVIEKPEQHLEIFSRFARVVKLGADVQDLNWKKSVSKVIKPTSACHFPFALSKRIIITKNSEQRIQVCGEAMNKSELGSSQLICRRGKKIEDINPSTIAKRNVIKDKKISTVTALLKAHYGEKWRNNEDLQFYKFVLDEGKKENEENLEREEERLCEYVEEGPNVRI